MLAYVPEGDIAKREGHMAYPGTISVPPETFKAVLDAAAQSFAAHGFKPSCFWATAGRTRSRSRVVAAELSRRLASDGVRAINAGTYYAANGGVGLAGGGGRKRRPPSAPTPASRDTSELMAVYPEGVRVDLRVADKDGVSGDPARATAERGEKLLASEGCRRRPEISKRAKSAPRRPPAASEGLFNRFLALGIRLKACRPLSP